MKTNISNQVTDKKQIFSTTYKNRKQPTEAQKEALQEKRNLLKELSKPYSAAKKKGELNSVNDGLKILYAEQGHTELKTLREWNKAGFSIIKGEKALLLWGSKKTSISRLASDASADPYDFYPICFVFSQKQVKEREINNDSANN